MNNSFFVPVRFRSGNRAVAENEELIASFGRRCLIVTGSHSAKISGALDDVLTVFNKMGISYDIYNGVTQNPSVAQCREAGEKANRMRADFILGIGGGSPLDAAKAAAVFARSPEMTSKELYSLKWKHDPLPIVLVGTTAGTGSEVTSVSVLTDDDGLKKSIRDDRLYPSLSLGDPGYTYTLSRAFTISTAVDTLCHCMESYFNKTANEFSAAAALRGSELVLKSLKKLASEQLPDERMRERLYDASILGGLAISVTGTAFPHAMGYFLSEKFDVPHGTACGVFLPAFIDYNARTVPSKARRFFYTAGMDKMELKALIRELLPPVEVEVDNELRLDLKLRWQNNRGFLKTPGNFTADNADALIQSLFQQR